MPAMPKLKYDDDNVTDPWGFAQYDWIPVENMPESILAALKNL
jgi:hypothetical protein